MKRRVLGLLVVTALLLAVDAIAAACGNGEDELTLEEYFLQVESVRDNGEERMDALFSELTADVGPDASEEEQIQVTRDGMTGGLPITEDLVDKLRDIDPPAVVEDAHKELLEAGEDSVAALRDLVARIAVAESLSEVNELFDDERMVGAEERADRVCFDLQEIADANGIDVDLECGE